ncbi:MAG: DUF4347 domain-containing protein [Phycisphaerae bacterium]|nr:DUF4347 domain-containing protein [Phycisphaerae bacterium]
MSRFKVFAGVFTFAAASALPSSTFASLLSDSQLYFDPASIPFTENNYPVHDLTSGGLAQFGSPGRRVVGANILPMLRDNDYSPGYSFSMADYLIHPNQAGTYAADLTDGLLTAQFEDSGAYHMRVNYEDGTSEVHSIFVDAGVGDPYGGQDRNNGSAPWKEVNAKDGDLYIISTGAGNDGFINSAVSLLGTGANTARAATIQQAKDAIMARQAALGRKIKVVIIGHGFQGSIRLGHGDNAERINNSGDPNSMSGTDFGNMIKDKVSMINLFGCNTGGGVAGGQLLADITATGVMATAYTSTVGLTRDKWYAYTWGTKVPSPGWLSLAGAGLICVARRRR